MAVADLLRESRGAHQRYRQLSGSTRTPNYPAAEREIRTALERRQQAHAEDPGHSDPEWGNDTAQHVELLAFYERWLSTP
jgi:hypothetical protein